MSINIETFRSTVKTLAKPSLFECFISGSSAKKISSNLFKFTCKAAKMPGSTLGKIDVPYMDRKIPFPGSRTYADWDCTVLSDGNYTIFKELYDWYSKLNGPETNVSTTDINNDVKNFCCDIFVRAKDMVGANSIQMKLVGAFPLSVTDLAMDWSTNDSAMEINVTFAYAYAVIDNNSNPESTASSSFSYTNA